MTTSAADHDDPTKATITDVATLIAAGAGAGLSPVAPGTAGSIVATALLVLLVGYAGDLALVGVVRAHCFGGVVIQACRRLLGV
jgi:phosphatidylglycerophosphatase A